MKLKQPAIICVRKQGEQVAHRLLESCPELHSKLPIDLAKKWVKFSTALPKGKVVHALLRSLLQRSHMGPSKL